MDARKTFQEKVEAQIEQFNMEFQKIEAEAKLRSAEMKEARADAALTLENHVDSLKQSQKELEQKLSHMREASSEGWDEMKTGVERALEELEESFGKAREHFKCAIK